MKQLSKYYINQAYFVKEGVVYDIKKAYTGNDACANKAEKIADKLPVIKVTNNETSAATTYYLDSFIADGDKFNGTVFKKTKHSETEEKEITMQAYFKELVEEEISALIKTYFTKSFSWFNDNLVRLGIPAYALKGKGFNVEGTEFEQVEFNEEYFNEAKCKAVKDEIIRKANEVLDTYKYEWVNGEPEFDVQPKGTELEPQVSEDGNTDVVPSVQEPEIS